MRVSNEALLTLLKLVAQKPKRRTVRGIRATRTTHQQYLSALHENISHAQVQFTSRQDGCEMCNTALC